MLPQEPALICCQDQVVPPNTEWAKGLDGINVVDAYANPPNPNTYLPGEFSVNTTKTQDAMPFGDGPGVMSGLPKGMPGFWNGMDYANKLWEVVACPVADVKDFFLNPLHCFFGTIKEDGSNSISDPFEFFAAIFKDTNANVLSFLGGGNIKEDGCHLDDAGWFGTLVNIVTFETTWYVI
jgi:hypothetical protein